MRPSDGCHLLANAQKRFSRLRVFDVSASGGVPLAPRGHNLESRERGCRHITLPHIKVREVSPTRPSVSPAALQTKRDRKERECEVPLLPSFLLDNRETEGVGLPPCSHFSVSHPLAAASANVLLPLAIVIVALRLSTQPRCEIGQ